MQMYRCEITTTILQYEIKALVL